MKANPMADPYQELFEAATRAVTAAEAGKDDATLASAKAAWSACRAAVHAGCCDPMRLAPASADVQADLAWVRESLASTSPMAALVRAVGMAVQSGHAGLVDAFRGARGYAMALELAERLVYSRGLPTPDRPAALDTELAEWFAGIAAALGETCAREAAYLTDRLPALEARLSAVSDHVAAATAARKAREAEAVRALMPAVEGALAYFNERGDIYIVGGQTLTGFQVYSGLRMSDPAGPFAREAVQIYRERTGRNRVGAG